MLSKAKDCRVQATKGKKAYIYYDDLQAKQPSSQIKQSQNDSVYQLLNVTIAAFNTTKDLIPIALAQGILGTIANILTIVQSAVKNKSDFQAIADKCETIRDILQRATEDATEDDASGNRPGLGFSS
ncbi:hypothetical protein DFJ58DRAFT_733997 [Suillus subalutaceus]|uniref:uncharacterized protein n=1 Tax=Suillus subalutaceus TaxID=48586 RepID=UPI001B881BE8|nr:uncharacterized protein DFJ58DRAFT_733997 [Suillus subalutaceus]KAG1838164.1 hypothetical protein DFJ58DRAFT_733997 [Suillus subalutaceus]